MRRPLLRSGLRQLALTGVAVAVTYAVGSHVSSRRPKPECSSPTWMRGLVQEAEGIGVVGVIHGSGGGDGEAAQLPSKGPETLAAEVDRFPRRTLCGHFAVRNARYVHAESV